MKENALAQYRKRPLIVNAEQFHHPATSPRGVRTEEDGRAYVVTIHGQKAYLAPGDWVIEEPDGEHFYPCKPDVFAATYDAGTHSAKTLASQVDDLACRCIRLEGLAGEMLATVKLNVERGYLVAQNDEGKLNLQKIIESWTRKFNELTGELKGRF